MGFRFDEESRDSVDAGRPAIRSFSMMRARKRELLEEQRSTWAEGRPAPPEEFLGRWPTDPNQDPDAASLLLEDYLQRRRHGEEGSLSDYKERFPAQSRALEGLLAQETIYRSMGGKSDSSGLLAPPARGGRRGLRLPPAAAPGRGRLRPGLPGRAGRPGRPARRPEGQRHRGERAADPRPAPAHQHRPDLFAPRGPPRGPAGRLHALPRRGEPLGGPVAALGRFAAARPPASSSSAPSRRSSRRGPTRCRSGTRGDSPRTGEAPSEPSPPAESSAGEDQATPAGGPARR